MIAQLLVIAAALSCKLVAAFPRPDEGNEPDPITYRYDTLTATGNNALSHYTESQREILLSINRMSENRLKSGTVLVVPDTFAFDRLHYAPFPRAVQAMAQLPECILVSLRIQAFAAYEYGKLVRWGPVSTGKKQTPTPGGIFYTNWKARLKRSSIDHDWIMPWYVNIENQRGIAFHEYMLPGYPASHGCIRLLKEDAIWIYNWADEWTLEENSRNIVKNGTPVVIYGQYNYGSPGPWKNLVTDPLSTAPTDMEEQEMLARLQELHHGIRPDSDPDEKVHAE